MGGRPIGFDYETRGAALAVEVIITHGGKRATVLRGEAAVRFLQDVGAGDPQQVMARVTGNYKRGNERTARNHARNRGR